MRASATKAYLDARARLGVKFGLETMHALLRALDHPERGFPSLLVAGTNGKGSVVAYVDAALRGCGLRVGRYTSPHLVRVHERITVGGEEISGPALFRAVGRVRAAADRLVAEGVLGQHPTYFEVLTAAAFDHSRTRRVDVAVLEVGLGGRLDATNVVEPLASAIVSVDFDHREFLGDSLASIAGEKAGVLRAGRPTVLGPLPDEAHAAIERRASELGALLVPARDGARIVVRGRRVDLVTPSRRYPGLRPLPGAHQRDNLVVAVRLVEEAQRAGLAVKLDRVGAGIAATRWPGRLERVAGRPPLVLDGAHNPAGARALAAEMAGRRPFVLLFGAMADKDVREVAATLFPLADALVLTAPRLERAASPADVAARAPEWTRGAHLEPDVGKALRAARRLAGPTRPVLVAGSLYLVGEVKALLQREARINGRRA